jgi:hypothetical protein
MKLQCKQAFLAAFLAGTFCVNLVGAGVTNTVPWWDSFESYTNGASVVGTNGWTGETSSSGVVVTNSAVINLLVAYTNSGGRTYPLPATHTNVLQTTARVVNDVHSTTGGVVAVDFMAWPTAQATNPPVSTNLHYAFYINTNANLVVWHQNRSGGTTNNEWRALTNGNITVNTNDWNRFTVIQDYGHNMFQIRLNESANPLSDPVGWTIPGVGSAPTGTWFHMVKTNAWQSHVMLDGDTTNYVDDLVLTNRCVTWSTNHFGEAAAPNGSIEATPVFDITLRYDTFAGTNNEVLGSGAITVTNVPPGLTGVVTRVGDTSLRLSLTGQAVVSDSVNSISNLTVVLKDSAFSLGNAADVTGRSNGTIVVTFQNSSGTGALTPDATRFGEAAANDGSISNTLTFTLTVATFTNVSPLVEGVHYTVSGVPSGLGFVLDRSNESTVVARLANSATLHATANITNLNVSFLDGAFQGLAAAAVIPNAFFLAVDFWDAPVLTYSGTNFFESATNNGNIGGGVAITLTGDTFTNDTFTAGVHYTAPIVPDGLAFVLTYINPSNVTASLTGAAGAHAASNSTAITGFAFRSAAFQQVAAGNIVGSATNFAVVFSNQPVLSVSGTNFAEVAANNGAIGNSQTITLEGTHFVNVTFETNTHYAVTNVPPGLTFHLAYESDTQLVATLSGQASNHRVSNDVGDLAVTFQDAAFTGGIAASNIVGHPLVFAVAFSNPPALTYSRTNFMETLEGRIDNSIPITLTLSDDTFAADVTNCITVAGKPDGLTALFTRVGDTQLSVMLNGAAAAHASGDSVLNMTFTFHAGAFGITDYNQVDHYSQALSVTFNDLEVFNTVPYSEPFEGYANGLWLGGTNGWKALYYADAGVVTNDDTVTARLQGYLQSHVSLPLNTTHRQTLSVKDSMRVAVHSEMAPVVYLDFMVQPVAMQEAPECDTNLQYAFYVSTNLQLVVWHRNWAVVPHSNEWLTVQNSTTIDTSHWVRFTVAQDYSSHMFQIWVNEGAPVSDPAGWTEGGGAPTGSWFHMVQTNASMSHFTMSGIGQAYLDDLSVRTNRPVFGFGTVFKIR